MGQLCSISGDRCLATQCRNTEKISQMHREFKCDQSVRWSMVSMFIHHNRPSVVALILSTEWSMQAGRAVVLKTTKSAQAGFLAPPKPISSRSHNFPNIAPIDVLFDSGCSLDSTEDICLFKKVKIPPKPPWYQPTWQRSKKSRKTSKITRLSTDWRPTSPSI